jgi:hypothetical protein
LGRELERELAEHLPKHVKGVNVEESVKLILETLEKASEKRSPINHYAAEGVTVSETRH